MDNMTGMTPVQRRQWENAERIRKHGSGLTEQEFQGRETLLGEPVEGGWAKPTTTPTPMKMPSPMKRQKIMADAIRGEDQA